MKNNYKKIILSGIATLTVAMGVMLASNINSFDFKRLSAGSGETNTFTLTAADRVSYSTVPDKYGSYFYKLRGSSLHNGYFYSDDEITYAYGDYADGEVVFDSNYIVKAPITVEDYGGAAYIGFAFSFSGITKINSCTYVYSVNGVEETGFANIDGNDIYEYLSSEYGSTGFLALVSITISYSC